MHFKMRINTLFLILIMAYHHNILLAGANEDNESYCVVDRKLDNECGAYTYRVVKPILNHLKKLSDEIVKSEEKDNEIKKLNEQLALLQQEYRIQNDNKNKELQVLEEKFAQLEQGKRKLEQDLSVCQSKISDKETEHQKEISLKDAIIAELRHQFSSIQKKIEMLITQSKPNNNCDNFHKELTENSEKLKVCESQLVTLNINNNNLRNQLNASINNQTQSEANLKICQTEVKKLNETEETPIPSSCIPFRHYPGVHKIKTSKLGETDVLCDSETVGEGGGWLVIQQRINGKEDFYRDWNTYRNGFGSYVGEFFIGLEKLHQLTNSTQQELYIHMKEFNGTINYARYDNFKVGSEEEDYKLSSLGEFSSNGVEDYLRWHENQKFSTYDRDNDPWDGVNCAVDRHGGWWYKFCGLSNLNGEYSDVEKTGDTTIFWNDFYALKEVKMLIRPKYN